MVREAYIWLSLKLEYKKHFKTRYSRADQNRFCLYWFLIKPQNIIINQIQENNR